MKTAYGVFNAIIIASGILAGCFLTATVASSHDMGAMDDMPADQNAPMIHTMAPNAMGGHMHMDEHMRMTAMRPVTPEDLERARYLLDKLHGSIARYRDYRVALAQGMRIFLPTIPQEVYHFTDYAATGEEYQGHFDPSRPGSLLYTKNPDGGYTLVGAMYSAPPDATPEELDAMVPLSVARWHVHTNICLPNGISISDLLRGEIGAERADVPGMIPASASANAIEMDRRYGFMADGRFGFEGTISDPAQCTAAGGYMIPQAFGWMVHIYPFSGDDLKVAYGMSVPSPLSSNTSR